MGLVSVAPIGAGRFELQLGSGGYHPHRTTHLSVQNFFSVGIGTEIFPGRCEVMHSL